MMNLINCTKCGKAIEVGKEVKKGWLRKKSYHAECIPKSQELSYDEVAGRCSYPGW